MKSVRGLVWWVGRLVLRPAGGTASTVATVVVVALLAMLMCATAAGSLAKDRQTERGDSITPVLSFDREINESTLLTLDPSLSAQRRWNGEEVLRTYFAAAPDGPVVPGLAEMPAAGEYYASPELARAMKDDATLGALFASLRPVGVISQEGLVDPTELRAVVGIDRKTPLLVPVDQFGSTQALGSEAMRDDARLDVAVTGIVTALIWLPGIVLLVIAVRLGARTRDRRARAMHVLGLTTRQVRAVHALAAGVPSTFAAVLGVAVFVMLTGTLDRIPFTRIGFTDADVQLPWWAMAGCIVALAASVLAIVAGTVDPSPNDPPVRARTSVRFGPVTKLGIAFIGVGAGLLVAMRALVAIFGPFMAIGLWVACFLVAAGLAASGPALIARLFGHWAPRVWPGARLVGFRLASHASATSLRLGGLLAVLVVLLLGNQAFMSVLNGGTSSSWSERLDGVTAVPATLADLTGSLNLAAVDEAVPEGRAIAHLSARGNAGAVTVVFGDCARLEFLEQRRLENCSPGEPFWLDDEGVPGSRASTRITLPDGARIATPPRDRVVTIERLPEDLDGAVVLPTSVLDRMPGTQAAYLLVVPTQDISTALAKLSGAAPALQIDLGDADRGNPDTQRFPSQLEWLSVGAVLACLLVLLALTATAVGEVRERSRHMHGLRRLGGSRRALFEAHAWSVGIPVIMLGWIATVAGWLICVGMRSVDDRAAVPVSFLAAAALGSLGAGVLVTLCTLPGVMRPSDIGHLTDTVSAS